MSPSSQAAAAGARICAGGEDRVGALLRGGRGVRVTMISTSSPRCGDCCGDCCGGSNGSSHGGLARGTRGGNRGGLVRGLVRGACAGAHVGTRWGLVPGTRTGKSRGDSHGHLRALMRGLVRGLVRGLLRGLILFTSPARSRSVGVRGRLRRRGGETAAAALRLVFVVFCSLFTLLFAHAHHPSLSAPLARNRSSKPCL